MKKNAILTDLALSFEKQLALRCWPDFAHGSFYLYMIDEADALARSNDKGKATAAIFIYQQLFEEWLYAVDYWLYYEVAIALFPKRYEYIIPEQLMFGQLIRRIEVAQDFHFKKEIMKAATRLNSQSRVPAAHKLLFDGNYARIQKLATIAKASCDVFTSAISDIQNDFWRRFELLADRAGIPDERKNG